MDHDFGVISRSFLAQHQKIFPLGLPWGSPPNVGGLGLIPV